MKKKLLALALVASGLGITKAQTILWSENFSTPTPPALPVNWLQNNVDGLTPSSSVASYSFGTNAWVTRDASATYPAYGKAAASNSWYNPAGVANDWLISPQFSVSAGTYLEWEAIALDPSFPDGYQVLVSPTGGTTTAAFTTTLLSLNAENNSWTARSANLSAFVGQNIRVAFRNNSNDMFILLVDNIRALIPAANDGAVTTLTSVARYVATGSVTIGGQFKNNGTALVNNATMGYRVDNGPVVTQTITFSGLTYAQTAAYAFATQANLTPGPHVIKAWVSAVNGVAETNVANDTARTTVYTATQVRPRKALIEKFTSSTCAPCASLFHTNGFDATINSNSPNTGSDISVISYQMNWPSPGNDPSYNQHGFKRRAFYNVTGIPDLFANGKELPANTQAAINAAKAEPAWADLAASISVNGTSITANATITPYVTVNGPVRVYQAIMQKYYNFPGATTVQKDYFHAMRVMNPNGAGVQTNITAGTPVNVNFNHTINTVTLSPLPAQNSFNFWTVSSSSVTVGYEYVVFVQDTVSKDVLNSASAQFISTVGLPQLEKNTSIGVFPNPANNAATIAVKLDEAAAVSISIFDITGRLVYTKENEELTVGQNEITINTEKYTSGTYNIIVKAGDKTHKTKLVIVK